MKFAGKTATALLLVVYITAFAGFRLHECAVDHTVEILSVLEGDACEDVHHHHCHDEARCGHRHHHCEEDHTAGEEGGVQIGEADCCSNSLHVLSEAQIVSDDGDESSAAKCLVQASAPVCVSAVQHDSAGPTPVLSGAFRALPGRTALVLYSVRRV